MDFNERPSKDVVGEGTPIFIHPLKELGKFISSVRDISDFPYASFFAPPPCEFEVSIGNDGNSASNFHAVIDEPFQYVDSIAIGSVIEMFVFNGKSFKE